MTSSANRVLITGGAQRLGAVLCKLFAQAGWHVICQYRGSEAEAALLCREVQKSGYKIDSLHADLSCEDGRVKLINDITTKHGLINCVINNAAEFRPDTGLDFDHGQAIRQMEVNFMAPISLTRLVAQKLISAADKRDASAIHILDQKVFNLNPDYFSYTLSKLALERAVSLQAQALAPTMRVCGVAPGLMYLSGPQKEENFDLAKCANLMRSATSPEDVAKTCLFLATNSSITGTTICVDKGQHLVPLPRDIMFVVDELLETIPR